MQVYKLHLKLNKSTLQFHLKKLENVKSGVRVRTVLVIWTEVDRTSALLHFLLLSGIYYSTRYIVKSRQLLINVEYVIGKNIQGSLSLWDINGNYGTNALF